MHFEIVQENISQTSSLLIIKKTEFIGRFLVIKWIFNKTMYERRTILKVLSKCLNYGGPQVSRQNQKATAKQKSDGKTKKPRQNKKATTKQKSHDKTKKLRRNKKATAKQKSHGKTKMPRQIKKATAKQ